MKIAVSSSSFAQPFAAGALTQLEWLERTASELDADGVVFDIAHFPRVDDEYVAQLKKVCVDLGLTAVALDAPGLFDPAAPASAGATAISLAVALGAGLVRTTAGRPGDVPAESFRATIAAARTVIREAKRANVTIVLSPASGTLVADAADARHVLKDVDSAWLRLALDVDEPRDALVARDRVLLETIALNAATSPAARASARGWLLLEGNAHDDPFSELRNHLRTLRRERARIER